MISEKALSDQMTPHAVEELMSTMTTYELLEFRYRIAEDSFKEVCNLEDKSTRTIIMRSLVYLIELEIGRRWNGPHDMAEGLPD